MIEPILDKNITERLITIKPFAGICHMVVCAHKDCTEEEILRFCNHDNPAGTINGWCRVEKGEHFTPVICENDSNHIHYVIAC